MRECPESRAHGLHELSWRLGVLHGERHGVRQSTDASGRISLSLWLVRAVCTWKHWCIISLWPLYVAVIVAVFGCCLWCTIGFSRRCSGRNAWFASGWSLRRVWVLPVEYDWISVELLWAQFVVRQWIHVLPVAASPRSSTLRLRAFSGHDPMQYLEASSGPGFMCGSRRMVWTCLLLVGLGVGVRSREVQALVGWRRRGEGRCDVVDVFL